MGNILVLASIATSQAFLYSLKQLTTDEIRKLVFKLHLPMKYSGEHPDTLLNRNLPGFTLYSKTMNDLKTVGNKRHPP